MEFQERDDAPLREWKFIRALNVEMHTRVWDTASDDAGAGTTPGSQRIPIVLVAGLGMSSRYWVRLGRRLARRFDVYAPDMPGFGYSPPARSTAGSERSGAPGRSAVREQANQLLAWMDAYGVQRAILCGHSTGCQTVVDLASRFPKRVEKLILAAPTFEPGHRSLPPYIPRLLADAIFEVPSLRFLAITEYLATGIPHVLRQMHRTIVDPIEQKLRFIEAPTLVIAGQWDTLVSRRWAKRVTALLRRANCVVIDNVAHGMNHSAPNVMAEVISDFVLARSDDQARVLDSSAEISKSMSGPMVVASRDDPCRDPLGPPQPISPGVHGLCDYLVTALTWMLPSLLMCPPRTRWVLRITAIISLLNNLFTDQPAAPVRTLPMATHANVDLANGAQLLIAAATFLRRERLAVRRAVFALGCYHMITAALTAKPTGPARTIASH
ncbi:MAG: alpha/beta hydrolase [Phycisphaerae bacterium]|nr:alpha/beta hydrolase [Phycisphaerae bacterium]